MVADHQARRCWLASNGHSMEVRQRWALLVERFSKPAAAAMRTPYLYLGAVQTNQDWVSYASAFRKVKRYLQAGDCYQVNLTREFSVPTCGDSWQGYQRLRNISAAPFSAYLNLPWGQVLSVSPERFIRVQGAAVETAPIKGTRPRSANPAQDRALAAELAASHKDKAENLMIVDLMRNDLGKHCRVGSVRVPRLFEVQSFATVHHLVSTITATLSPGTQSTDLLRGAFPGGSITGAPKIRAMAIIDELEPHRRGVYCGSIGYIGYDGNMDTNIAIRTLVQAQGQAAFWAGGGIVHDSQLDAEYQETLDKAAAMLRLMHDVRMDPLAEGSLSDAQPNVEEQQTA
ncbi:MAG: aminodeoxychorismate synthase component I [Motiliproteus sp.]